MDTPAPVIPSLGIRKQFQSIPVYTKNYLASIRNWQVLHPTASHTGRVLSNGGPIDA